MSQIDISKLESYKLLLITYALINVSTLISRSVMTTVGNNDGKDCPKIGGPVLACSFYGLSMLILIGMTIKAKMDNKLNNIKLALFGLLIICNISIFIAYIPFAIKSQNQSSSDTECLTKENKKAIEIFEIIINVALIFLTPIMLFM